MRHLTDEVVRPGQSRKKAKLMDPEMSKSQEDSTLSVGKWHVRALVLSSLHKCFLFDAGNLEFLDSSNFQVSGNFLSILFQCVNLRLHALASDFFFQLSLLSYLILIKNGLFWIYFYRCY